MKTKTKKKIPQKLLGSTTYRSYFDSIDFAEWWEEFAISFNKNGTFKYPTVYSFIKVKSKNEKQKKFLWWILGPKVEIKDGQTSSNKEFETFTQFDWQECRENGFWYSSKNTEAIKTKAGQLYNSLEEVKEVGKVNLEDIFKIKGIIDQLDREYGGVLNIPDWDMKQNKLRIETYLNLRRDLQSQLHTAQMMYARTRGVDLAALDSLLTITGSAMLGTVSTTANADPAQTRKLDVIDKLRDMMLAKSSTYDMPLPDKDMENIVKGQIITIDKKKIQ